jgi:hypothetical protein
MQQFGCLAGGAGELKDQSAIAYGQEFPHTMTNVMSLG